MSLELLVSGVVSLGYLVAGVTLSKSYAVAAGIISVISGVVGVTGKRWSLFVLGALLAVSAVVVGLGLLFLVGYDDMTWPERLKAVLGILAMTAPLFALQLWNFSRSANRVA